MRLAQTTRLIDIVFFIAKQPAPTPHLAHPEGCAALRSVLVTVARASRSCENFSHGFDLHFLQASVDSLCRQDGLSPAPLDLDFTGQDDLTSRRVKLTLRVVGFETCRAIDERQTFLKRRKMTLMLVKS